MTVNAPTLGQVEAESAADSMRAVLAETGQSPDEAVAEVLNGATETVAEEPPAKGEPAEPKPATEPVEAVIGPDGRARDPVTKKFVAKPKAEGEAAPAAEPAPVEEPEPSIEEDPLDPLPDWPADKHEAFRKLPRSEQQFVLDTIKAAQDRAAEASKAGGKYAELEEILAPRREALARDGLTDATYIRQLTALSDFAGRDPAGFVQWFIQQRQIDPASLFPQQEQPGDGEIDDPVYQRLMQTNQTLQQKLDNLERTVQNQQLTVETQSQQRVASEIEGFGKAVDDKGRQLHPYFEQVKPLMGALMRAGRASDLKSAYDMACRADPDVNAKIASAQKAQEERDRQKRDREKAEAAKRAGASVSGSPGDRVPPAPTGDIREDMRRLAVERGMISA